ncbi:MAG: hypothetical protein EB127_11845 [Alphaproteobacteria bacterium]|nr:hypothetical protein [Alphaproteobacteria bacterium]
MSDTYRKITLTSNVFIKYIDDQNPVQGDLRLLMHDDAISPFPGDYNYCNMSGYFKGEVFDGKFWQFINLDEFLNNREYKYPKKQLPIHTALLCKELLEKASKELNMFRTYRGHYTIHEYIPHIRITKANRNRKTSV